MIIITRRGGKPQWNSDRNDCLTQNGLKLPAIWVLQKQVVVYAVCGVHSITFRISSWLSRPLEWEEEEEEEEERGIYHSVVDCPL